MRDTWGQITKIELATNNTAKYTYDTHAFSFESTGGDGKLPLVASDYKNDFTAVDIPEGTSSGVTAAGMFAPTTTASALSLTITTAKLTQTVTVDLYATGDNSTKKPFDAGKTHKVTLTFNSTTKDITVTKTEVAAWGTGYTGTGDVKPENATTVNP